MTIKYDTLLKKIIDIFRFYYCHSFIYGKRPKSNYFIYIYIYIYIYNTSIVIVKVSKEV